MRVTIRARDARELSQKRERMLKQLGGDAYVVTPKVEHYPSPLRAVRQMEELINKSGQRLMDDIVAELTGIVVERVSV